MGYRAFNEATAPRAPEQKCFVDLVMYGWKYCTTFLESSCGSQEIPLAALPLIFG